MKKAPFKIVEISWVDSESSSDWQSIEDLTEDGTLECRSVGYLLADKEDRIILAGSVGMAKDDVAHGHITIPKAAILSRRELRTR